MFCSKGYSESYQLKQHIKFVHHKERPFQCEQCDKAFSTAIQLRNHMQYHTGKFRYQCPICEKCFITGQSLNKHIRNSRPCREKKPELTKIANCKLLLQSSEDNVPEQSQKCIPVDCIDMVESLPLLETFDCRQDDGQHLPAIHSIHHSLMGSAVQIQYIDMVPLPTSHQQHEMLSTSHEAMISGNQQHSLIHHRIP